VTKEYRGRHAIIAKILRTINDKETEGVSRIATMYNCFLSYTQLREYLAYLVEKGLINEFPEQFKSSGNEKFAYKITDKGLRFLQISQEFENLIGSD
jgi:predicted transcriptional regulator